jgi:adenylate cyclase
VVRKRRELWLLRSTRVHLDRVEELGEFVELETVFGEASEDAYRAEHAAVLSLLEIGEDDTIPGSYIDL